MKIYCDIGKRELEWESWWGYCPCCGCRENNYYMHHKEHHPLWNEHLK